jgi:hypothetical protein
VARDKPTFIWRSTCRWRSRPQHQNLTYAPTKTRLHRTKTRRMDYEGVEVYWYSALFGKPNRARMTEEANQCHIDFGWTLLLNPMASALD